MEDAYKVLKWRCNTIIMTYLNLLFWLSILSLGLCFHSKVVHCVCVCVFFFAWKFDAMKKTHGIWNCKILNQLCFIQLYYSINSRFRFTLIWAALHQHPGWSLLLFGTKTDFTECLRTKRTASNLMLVSCLHINNRQG